MNYKISVSDIKIITLLFLYKLFLDLIYPIIIVPIYGYSGFLNDFSLGYYLFNWLIYVITIPSIVIISKRKSIDSIIILILLLVSFVPGLVLISFMPQKLSFLISFITYWYFIIIFSNLLPSIKIKYQVKSIYLLYSIFYLMLGIIVYISGKYTGFRLNFNLLNVYELRNENLLENLPSIFQYVFSASKTCFPILFIFFIKWKQYINALLVVIGQLLSFSIDGSKSAIFSLAITYILYKFFKKYSNKIIVQSITGITVLSFVEFIFLKTNYIVLFFIRRALFLPNLLNFYYYDFFVDKEKVYFTQGIIGRLGIKSNYDMNIPNLIGKIYFNAETMVANNGLFSDAFYNLGYIGIVIMPFFIVFSLRILKMCSEGIQLNIILASAITISYIFLSSSFFTVMLTHGFIIICLVLYIIPKKEGV